MKKALKLSCMLLIVLGLRPVAGKAQVASYTDEHGNVVFINSDPVVRRTPVKQRKQGAAASVTPSVTTAAAVTAAVATTPVEAVASQPSAPFVASAPFVGHSFANTPAMVPVALNEMVQRSAEKHHVDPALVRAVIGAESNWNSTAVSSKGALGLMQLIPGTAQRLGVGNAFDPAQNVDAGTRYLSSLLGRYNGDVNKALAAYNAGPGAVDRFGGVPNYRETQNYVQKVTSTYFHTGSDRQSFAYRAPAPIYRETDASGRVIFVNE